MIACLLADLAGVSLRDVPTQNLGQAMTHSWTPVARNGHLAYAVYELDNGAIDLNGDGDAIDRILHRINLETGSLVHSASRPTAT